MHIIEQASIKDLTTLRIGGRADKLFFPSTPEELISLLVELQDRGIKWSMLGGGSNLLVSSQGVGGAVISTSEMDWVNRVSPDAVVVGAGARLPKLAGQLAHMGLSGCEFMEGIPGSIGGAVVMNAGAHGHWTSNILEKVTLIDTHKGQVLSLTASQFDFGYRSSNIDPNRHVIVEAKFRLSDGMPDQIMDKMKQYRRQRTVSQPKGFSSGCIFRNPSMASPAGRLIDEMGFKGDKLGGAEISNIHANFILNSQGATSDQIIHLISRIQLKAWNTKNIWLQPEVYGMGNFTDEEKVIWLHPGIRDKELVNMSKYQLFGQVS
ncbi:MAG: UDP-N-acetylmuramate dehydrogenase [Candidatus Caenarcaniphilales bacterium]|nr:UDP-N-acetylmuramate dehydrogenase [Candidatus Caenarcaniphilales bacterium]